MINCQLQKIEILLPLIMWSWIYSVHNLKIKIERGSYVLDHSNMTGDECLCKGCFVIGISSVDEEINLLYDCTPTVVSVLTFL